MYRHTQRSALALFVLCLGAVIPIGFLISGMLAPMEAGLRITLLAASLAMLVSAFVFSSLTIAIRDGQLSWWFGPGVVKMTVPLSTIVSAEPTTTSILRPSGW